MFTREFRLGEEGLHSTIATALMRIGRAHAEPIYLSKLSGEAVPIVAQLRVLGLGVKPFESVILVVNTPDASTAQSIFDQVQQALTL